MFVCKNPYTMQISNSTFPVQTPLRKKHNAPAVTALLVRRKKKAEIRFDPDLTNGQDLADGITGLGYPTRHLSTVVSGDGDGDANGAAAVTLEVLGVAGPECISNVRRLRRAGGGSWRRISEIFC